MVTDIVDPQLESLSIAKLIPGESEPKPYMAVPGQYHPLTEAELKTEPTFDQKVAALAQQAERLENQLFGGITQQKKWDHHDWRGWVNHREIINLPEQLPNDAAWEDYLTGELMYHKLAKRQGIINSQVGEADKHELVETRASLAIGALKGENSRGDLVVAFAEKVKKGAEKNLAGSSEEAPYTPLFKARVDLANQMVAAFKARFPQK